MSIFANRQIKYRAISIIHEPSQNIYPGDCVYGTYTERGGQAIIVTDVNKPLITVEPDSVSEFTGLYDKNDHELYEHDIFKSYDGHTYVVEYFNGAFGHRKGDEFTSFAQDSSFKWVNNRSECIIIIGNRIEHPSIVNFLNNY